MIVLTICLYLMSLTIFLILIITPSKKYTESIDYQGMWCLIAWLLFLIGNLIEIFTS
jgi:hypothetical protein